MKIRLLSVIFLVFAICGCSKEDEFVISGLVLSHESLEMVRGEIVTLETVILPQSSAGERIAWYTSDGAVATVDKDGNVKARALGNAVIYAICHDMTAAHDGPERDTERGEQIEQAESPCGTKLRATRPPGGL